MRPATHPRAALAGVALAAALAGAAGCGDAPARLDPDEARARAERAADELAGTLLTRLTDALGEGGAAGALHVCSDAALDLTAEIGARHGVSIGRTSHRVRNPENAPDDYERAWLERALERLDERREDPPSATAEVVETRDEGPELRYVRPLYLAELCVQCHGAPDRLGEGVPEALARLYPADRATGFEPGDLRGVISVRVPLDG